MSGPPGGWEWVLRWLLPPGQRDAALGDAAEEWAMRAEREGERAANRWYRPTDVDVRTALDCVQAPGRVGTVERKTEGWRGDDEVDHGFQAGVQNAEAATGLRLDRTRDPRAGNRGQHGSLQHLPHRVPGAPPPPALGSTRNRRGEGGIRLLRPGVRPGLPGLGGSESLVLRYGGPPSRRLHSLGYRRAPARSGDVRDGERLSTPGRPAAHGPGTRSGGPERGKRGRPQLRPLEEHTGRATRTSSARRWSSTESRTPSWA